MSEEQKNMARASFTIDESGVAVFERNNDVIVVPAGLAMFVPMDDAISEPMPDETWERLRDIVKRHKDLNRGLDEFTKRLDGEE